jgi:hypothetical protein
MAQKNQRSVAKSFFLSKQFIPLYASSNSAAPHASA